MIQNKKDFDFDKCLLVDSSYNHIPQELLPQFTELLRDGSVERLIGQLSDYVYGQRVISRQCVVHNDFHTSAILVQGKSIKVRSLL